MNGLAGDDAYFDDHWWVQGDNNPTKWTTVAGTSTFVDDAAAATSDVLPGARVTVSELLGSEADPNTGSYNTALVCTGVDGANSTGVLTGSFEMPKVQRGGLHVHQHPDRPGGDVEEVVVNAAWLVMMRT